MRLFGCVLLLSGWLITVFAITFLTLFHLRMMFVLAGTGVEVLGFALLTHAYKLQARRQG